MSKSNLEEQLLLSIRANGLPEPEREFMFAKQVGRKFRADFAYPEHHLLIECEGGVWVRGRHNRPIGFEKDIDEKTDQEIFVLNQPLEKRTRLGLDFMVLGTPYPYYPSRIYIEKLSKYGDYGISYHVSIYFNNYGFFGYAFGVSLKKYKDRGNGFFYGASFEMGGIGYSKSDLIGTSSPSFMICGTGKLGWQTALTERLGINIGADMGVMTDFSNSTFIGTIFIGFNYVL